MKPRAFAPLLPVLATLACAPATPPAADPEPAPAPLPEALPEPESARQPDPPTEPDPVPEPAPVAALPDGSPVEPCLDPPPPGMACIPGGAFLRGTDDGEPNTRPAATIHLQTFYMDLNEVTVEEYKACKKAKRCPRGGPLYNDFSNPKQPITGPNWFAAVKYCEQAGKHLPTEAQWEKAARGPEGNLTPFGNEPLTCEVAIIMDERGRSCGVEKKKEHPKKGRPNVIGTRPPGAYGLYDMAGNSWEWVADWASESYEKCGEACLGVDPKGPCGGADKCRGHDEKVVRGGSWYWPAEYATGVHRRTHFPINEHSNFHHFGFRCAASASEAQALAADRDIDVAAGGSPPAETAEPGPKTPQEG